MKSDSKNIANKICEKYGLIDHGQIHCWAMGLLDEFSNKRRIFRNLIDLKNQKTQQSTIKVTLSKRVESDKFKVKEVFFTVNTPKRKALKICRLFKYGIDENQIEQTINQYHLVSYPVIVSNVSISENEEIRNISHPKYTRSQNLIIKTTVL